MSQIGIAGMGQNSGGNNGRVWIGNDGPATFTFHNRSPVGIILLTWDMYGSTDYQAMCLNVRTPRLSWSIPAGGSVTVSAANQISGGWSALYDHKTILNNVGQVWNTWGEFTTGDYGVVDISREVHMGGNPMDAVIQPTGCVSNFDRCVFVCTNGADTCGAAGTYDLQNCDNGSQNGAGKGSFDGQPSGGCYGFMNNQGHVEASFY